MSDTEIEATVDLRGVDAGTLSEWRELIGRGLVKRDADLVLVADVARMIEKARAAERERAAARSDEIAAHDLSAMTPKQVAAYISGAIRALK